MLSNKTIDMINNIIEINGHKTFLNKKKYRIIPYKLDAIAANNHIQKYYSGHSFLDCDEPEEYIKQEIKWPTYTLKKNVLTIKIFTVGWLNEPDQKKYTKIIKSILNKKYRDLVIDLTEHRGGNMWITVEAFKKYFADHKFDFQ